VRYLTTVSITELMGSERKDIEHLWNAGVREKSKNLERPCPSAILSTKNLSWIGPRSRPALRAQTPETDPLSHGKAKTPMG